MKKPRAVNAGPKSGTKKDRNSLFPYPNRPRPASTTLTRYDAARQALAEAKAVNEVKDIRDQAVAMQTYAKQASDREMEADAAAIRMRAERQLGEMMKAQKETVGLNVGTKGSRIKGARVSEKPTLTEAGIGKNLAHQARTLGAMPEAKFKLEVEAKREAIITKPHKLKVVNAKPEKSKKTPTEVGTGAAKRRRSKEVIQKQKYVRACDCVCPSSNALRQFGGVG